MRKILLTLMMLCVGSVAQAATTWYACSGGGNWNGASVWTSILADEVGCTASTGNPVAGDTATLNSNSGNITLSANAAAAIIDETGYTGTLAFGIRTLTLTGTATIGGAMTSTSGIIAVAGGVTLLSTATGTFPLIDLTGSQTITSGGFTWPGSLITLAAGPGTYTLVGNLIIGGTYYTSANGAIFSGAYNITVANLVGETNSGASSSITVPSSQTFTITNSIQLIGNYYSNSSALTLFTFTVKSGTSTTAFNLNYTGTLANENIHEVIFTDTNASGSSVPIYDYFGGTLTRTTNIVNVTAANINSNHGYTYGG